jgi:hypothetical protein
MHGQGTVLLYYMSNTSYCLELKAYHGWSPVIPGIGEGALHSESGNMKMASLLYDSRVAETGL